MRQRGFAVVGIAIVVVMCGPRPVAGQVADAPAAAPRSTASLTPEGRPDLQGTWDAGTVTPLERPPQFAGRPTITEAEAAEYAAAILANSSLDRRERDVDASGEPSVGGYNEFWVDRGTALSKVGARIPTSMIVDPPDGRIPPMTAEAAARDAALGGLATRPDIVERQGSDLLEQYLENPEQRPLGERCLLGFGSASGPPTLPSLYNNFRQIVQTPGHVMLLSEMVHDARVIRIGGEHLPPEIRRWNGDSVGHWEGDTLVVDTTNFTDKTRFRGSSRDLHVVERFSRIDPDTLLYRFTVDDPTTWAIPWSGEYAWKATEEHIYEYACHEGNYALPGILAGARAAEARASGTESR